MIPIKLQRFGQRPLYFEGMKMVGGKSESPSRRCSFEIAVYEVSPSGFAAHLLCSEKTEGDHSFDTSFAVLKETPGDVVAFFQDYDPSENVSFIQEWSDCKKADNPEELAALTERIKSLQAEAIDTYQDLIIRTFKAS